MNATLIIAAGVLLICAALSWFIASERGLRPVWGWTLLGLVFGIFGVGATLIARPKRTVAPPVTSSPGSAGYCPRCGAALGPGARFCPGCGTELASAHAPAVPQSYSEKYAALSAPQAPVAQPAPAQGHRRLILTGLLFVLVVLIAFAVVESGALSPAGTAGNVPPVGSIWFGSSFDPSTFAMSGVTTTTPPGSTVALVAQLPRSISSGQATMRVSLEGNVILNQTLNMSGSGQLFGTTVGPLNLPGTYTYQIVDVGGNVMATGTLTVGT
jgi:hypothetical protein